MGHRQDIRSHDLDSDDDDAGPPSPFDALATLAMQRGTLETMRASEEDGDEDDEPAPKTQDNADSQR